MAKQPARTRYLSVEIGALVPGARIHAVTADAREHEFIVIDGPGLRLEKSGNPDIPNVAEVGYVLDVVFVRADRPTIRVSEPLMLGRLATGGIALRESYELGSIEALSIQKPSLE